MSPSQHDGLALVTPDGEVIAQGALGGNEPLRDRDIARLPPSSQPRGPGAAPAPSYR